MINELLLIFSLPVIYGMVLLWYRLFGRAGMYGWTVFATIAANIEVMILVNAFGMEQTLGNILFASSFLVTDILSETEGKKAANRAVDLGILTSVCFIVVSQLWLMYQPSPNDTIFPHIQQVFSGTPRMMLAGLLVYAVVQKLDVWLYHRLWAFTDRKFGEHKKFLWLRNNLATLISQLCNAVLFTFAAFWGTYDLATLMQIIWVSCLVFLVTSLADTPVVYWARRISEKREKQNTKV